jgi:fibronectin type 3 domain-containing protein
MLHRKLKTSRKGLVPRKCREFGAAHQTPASALFILELLECRVLLSSIVQPAGELGINLAGNDDFRTTALWLNVRDGFSPWMYPNTTTFLASTDQTSTAYPLVNAYAVNQMGGYPDGIYTLQYNGTGTITFSGMGQIVAGSTSQTVVNGVTTTTAQVYVQQDLASSLVMTATNVSTTDPITNIYLMMPGYSPSTTQIFNPAALKRLAPFSTIRLMDLFDTNSTSVANWSDRTTPQDFAYTTGAGIPYEDAIALGNALNENLWWNVPVNATPSFMTNLADLMKYGSDASGNPYTSPQANPVYAPLNPNLLVYIEYANELWHSGFADESYNLANAQANSALPGSDLPNVSSTISSQWNADQVLAGEQDVYQLHQLYEAFGAVYGNSLSSQVSFVFAADASTSDFTQASFAYMASMSATWGAPSSWIGGFAVPGYIALTSAQDVPGLTLDQVFADLNNTLTTTFYQTTAADVTFANSYGIPLYCYEGGQSLIPDDENASVELAAQADPRMGTFYTNLLNEWYTLGGSLFLPYSFVDGYNYYGAWGLLPTQLQTGSPKWDAVISRLVPAGDATLAGVVNYDDFLMLKAYWGATDATFQEGDFNGDGTVNAADLAILLANLDTSNLTPAQQADIDNFPANIGTGLLGTYYSDDNLQTPVLTRVDPTIDFNWANTSPDPSLSSNTYSVKWTGQIEAPTTETYEFRVFAGDGVRVFINGDEIINDWTYGSHEDEGQIALTAGQKYSIEIDFFQSYGAGNIDFQWETPTIPWTDVPASMLYPSAFPSTSTVSVTATSTNGILSGNTTSPAVFQLTRLGDPTSPLTVDYTMSGTAVDGTDYSTLSGTVTFPANASTTTVSVDPLPDGNATAPETATLNLISGNSTTYSIGANSSATVSLSQLPTGWTETDIGYPSPLGSAVVNGNTWTVSAGGADIYNNYDQFSFVNTQLTGDSTIVATVNTQADTDPNAKTGVMFRDSTSTGGAFVALLASPGGGVNMEWRTSDGGYAVVSSVLPTTTLPIWLALTRQGNTFTGYYSLDGVTWTAVQTSSPLVVTLPSTALAGLAVTSHDQGTANLSTFTSVAVFSGTNVVSVAATAAAASVVPTTQTGTYTFTRTGPDVSPLTISYTLGGTGVEGTDYSLASADSTLTTGTTGGTITFAAGSPTATITLTPLLTGQYAGSTALLTLGSSTAYTVGSAASATINIAAFASVTVAPTTAVATEGAAPPDTGTWTFTRTGSTASALTVNFTLSGTAAEGTDYTLSSPDSALSTTATGGAITFAPGSATATLLLTPNNAAATTSVTASLTLASGSYALGTTAPITISILPAPDGVSLAATDASATVGAIPADTGTWTLTRTGSTAAALTTNFTLSGTAVEGTDYSLASSNSTLTTTTTGGTITFAANASTATITLTPLATGGNKSAVLTLASGSYTITTAAGATISIAAAAPVVAALSDADIGSPADAGSASYNSTTGVWTVVGGGADIWNNADQFNFASTSVSGNATLIAEVTSLTNTDPWAKAGLMFRDGSTSNAANVAVFATPGNGVSLQWRTTAGGASNYTNIASVPAPTASAPVWLELVRTGNVFTASYSTNGTTYTTVGTETITLDTALSAGLAVTAHNNSLLTTATFANVAVPYVAGPVAIPTVPTIVAAPATGAVSLSWSPVAGATTYDLYRSTTTGNEGSTPYLTGLVGMAYTDTAVTAGTPYYYTLTAVNSAGQSSQSTETSATPTAATSTSALSDADIGSPTDAGSASYNSSTGVWTIAGGGSDIWNNADQFNFASTTVSGNATLITEVTSLTNTDPWGKAGLMFRDGSTSNAANVAVFATPGNGVSMQWRTTAGGTSSYTNIASVPAPTASAPIWLELVRTGNVFTAYYSTNGATYTTVGTVTITLDTALSAGLAVTAHNNSLLAAATFANSQIPYSATPVAIPPIPTVLASPAAGAVSLTWSPVSGAASYDLYRSTTTDGEGSTPYLTGLSGPTYSDTNVTAGIQYFYTLTAVNSVGGQSAQSTETSATPTAAVAPVAAPLSDADIGSPTDAGAASYNSTTGIWTVAGGGADIWGNSDQFNFASTTVSGNATLIAEVTSLTNTDPWAKAGLMFRDGSTSNAANVAVFATPGNGVSLQWRTTAGGASNYTNIASVPAPTASAPVWLELVRTGNVFTASYSTNGTTYTTVGTETITLDTALSAGLAVTAHNNSLLTTATFANVAVPYVAGPVAIPTVPTIVAAPATGAVSLSWSPVAGATTYDLYRSTTTGNEGSTPYLTGLVGMAYTDTAVTAGTPYYYTLTAVNSAGQSSQSTETSATPTAATSTSALSDADIGSPTDAGSASYNSSTGVWTIAGGGSDIWNNADQFNFASTTVSGNATLITEVTSLTNTDPWGKAGLMFRDGSTSNAANVAVFATPGNGVSMQWRTTAGGTSSYTNIASVPAPTASAPIWLELVRTGNVFTAYYSTNGATYTTVGTVTITLDTALSAGLAVTAHNNGLLATATFANVSV